MGETLHCFHTYSPQTQTNKQLTYFGLILALLQPRDCSRMTDLLESGLQQLQGSLQESLIPPLQLQWRVGTPGTGRW